MKDSGATTSVISSPCSSPPPDDSSTYSDEIHAITHATVLKCIVVTKKYLKYANKRLHDDGIELPVKLQLEADNKWDAKAIAFMCQENLGWQRIGYVVRDNRQGTLNNQQWKDIECII